MKYFTANVWNGKIAETTGRQSRTNIKRFSGSVYFLYFYSPFMRQVFPIAIKFVPYFFIQLTCIGKPYDSSFFQFRVETSEITDFHFHRIYTTPDNTSNFYYSRM